MKTIHKCTDGRGCLHNDDPNFRCDRQLPQLSIAHHHLSGCGAYKEKPPEPTLREMVRKLIFDEDLYDENLTHKMSDINKRKALLRDIVDYAYMKGMEFYARTFNPMANIPPSIVRPTNVYEELDIEE